MRKRTFLLLACLLLLIPVGIVAAQSSPNFSAQRFVIAGGGTAGSTSYSVTSVIGQAATDVVVSTNYKVSGGFLFPSNRRLWLPLLVK